MKKLTLLLLVSILLTGMMALAQITATGSLAGTVTDKTGGVVPSAAVKITNTATGLTREAKTGEAGLYRFDLLPSGTYKVEISMSGFANSAVENVGLFVGQTTTIDVSLSPSTQSETVTVESTGAPLVDTTRSDVSLPVSTSMVQDMPLNGRDFVSLAVLAPGAKPVDSYDPTKNRVGVFAVNGSSGRNVNITVNGIDDKDNTVGGPVMQLPLEAVEEFLISTQRFSAANGRSEGAAVNVITKSGTNVFHGSLYFFDREQQFNTLNYFEQTANGGSGDKSPFSRQQFGGSVGGPVRKNKDFVFFALERLRESTSIVTDPNAFTELSLVTNLGAVPSRTIPTPYFDWRYNGRWDHRFNDKHNMFFSYSNQNNNGQNDQSTSTNDLTAGNFTTNQLILANLTLNSVLTPTVVNSFTAGYQYWHNLIDSVNKVPNVEFSPQTISIQFGTNINVPQESFQRKWQFRDDLAITRGKHTFRTGFDYLYEPKLGGFFEFNPTPQVIFIDLPSKILSDKVNYPQGFATPGAVGEIIETAGNPYFLLHPKMFGLYFQDDWKISRRLMLNLGLRWDKDFGLIGGAEQGLSRTYQFLTAIHSPYAGALPQDDNKDFSPRVGFAYDVTGSGRHVVRGGFGIYYGQTFENVPLFMLQQVNSTLFATVLDITSSGPTDKNADLVPGAGKLLSQWRYGVDPIPAVPPPPTNLTAGAVGRLMDPYYHNPYTEQFNAGYSFQIDNANVVEVDYVHTLGLRESKTLDINPKLPALAGARPLSAAFNSAGLPLLGRIDVETSVGRSRYDGLNFSYRRRLSRRFSINSSYVLSRSLAYDGSAAAFRDRPFDELNYFASYSLGPTPSDSTHRGVISGIVELPWGVRFSTTMQAESGRPYNPNEGIDVTGQGESSTTRHAIVPKDQPTNYAVYATATAAQMQACLAAGTCVPTGFDSARGEPFFEWDIRAGKQINFGERAKLELFFQGFDLTNRANFGGSYNNNIRSSTYGTPNGFVTPAGTVVPRSFSGEFGAQFRF
ncbi:MAG: carboxypeptidase regulatory-like domain-containing protein [Acidobacteriia bacterium]|nr:carboxypeptidase regulatory-like domain-containing protein [Terriglobia bacterium]